MTLIALHSTACRRTRRNDDLRQAGNADEVRGSPAMEMHAVKWERNQTNAADDVICVWNSGGGFTAVSVTSFAVLLT